MSKYTLPRDADESLRLNQQHGIWTRNIGYLLNSDIQSKLPAHASVADVGTGTGAWLLGLAESRPLYQCVGLDISDKQFPDTKSDRLSFEICNILGEVPTHLVSAFDVVHVQCLICGLANDEWKIASVNLARLLKPGGWLQWSEAWNMAVVQNRPLRDVPANRIVLEAGVRANQREGRFTSALATLPGILKDSGFFDLSEDVMSSDRDPSTRNAMSRAVLGAMAGTLRMQEVRCDLHQHGGLSTLLPRCEAELNEDEVYYRGDIHTVMAKKPPRATTLEGGV